MKSDLSFRAKRGISRLNRYWVYILASKTGTFFTAQYNIDRLMYFEEFNEINDAIAAEKKIKGWNRQKKINLIRTKNPEIKDLGENLEILHFVQDDNKEQERVLL